MLEFVKKVFSWLFFLWQSLPEEKKEEIIDDVVDIFKEVFRDYYSSQKSTAGAQDAKP